MSRVSKHSPTPSYSSNRPIEQLENRQMFAVAPMFLAPSTLVFVGDAADDTLNLYDNGNGTISGNYTNPGGTQTPFGPIPGIQTIRVSLSAGNDNFNYLVYGDMTLGGARYVNADLGKGDDRARFEANKDIDVGFNTWFDFNVYGSYGRDQLQAFYSGELDGRLGLGFSGGDDDDYLATRANLDLGSQGRFVATSRGDNHDDAIEMIVRKVNPFDPVSVNAQVDGGAHVFGDKAIRTPLASDTNIEFLTVIP